MTAVLSEASVTDAELPYQSCSWCGSAMEHSRLFCPVCGSTRMKREFSTGVGTIRRVVRVIRPQIPGDPTRQICSVHLDEGFTVLAAVSHTRPLRLPEGTRVRLEAIVRAHPALEFTPC